MKTVINILSSFIRPLAFWPVVTLLFFGLSGCNQGPRTEITPASPQKHQAQWTSVRRELVHIQAKSLQELRALFAKHEYDFNQLHAGVPPLILDRFPDDHHQLRSAREKKRLFFMALLPMVLTANAEIEQERAQVRAYVNDLGAGKRLNTADKASLRRIAAKYKLQGDPVKSVAARDELLMRVDTIPPELVLAQAANESAWGTSRFVRQANNLFGEWTFTPGTGIVPEHRPEGATYEIRRFDSLYDSLKSYMININTHRAYRQLRQLRANLRFRGHYPDGITLAAGLTKYSSRGQAYVDDLRVLMRANKLRRFSDMELRNS